MWHVVLGADSPLAAWGQIAAIILALELFVFILIGLGLAAGLMFGFAWVREKAELVKKLRPPVDSLNQTTKSAIAGTLPPPRPEDNGVARAVAEIPVRVQKVEQKVEQGSDRVANAVIEFRARTMMAKQVAKAFFLPGLSTPRKELPGITAKEQIGPGYKSPGYRTLVEEKVPAAPTGIGARYSQAVGSDQLKDAPAR